VRETDILSHHELKPVSGPMLNLCENFAAVKGILQFKEDKAAKRSYGPGISLRHAEITCK